MRGCGLAWFVRRFCILPAWSLIMSVIVSLVISLVGKSVALLDSRWKYTLKDTRDVGGVWLLFAFCETTCLTACFLSPCGIFLWQLAAQTTNTTRTTTTTKSLQQHA
jgi:hypothetical protein